MRNLWIGLSGLVVLVLAGVTVCDMRVRVAQLEATPRIDPTTVRALDDQLRGLSERVRDSMATLRLIARQQASTAGYGDRLAQISCELDSAAASIAEQRVKLAQWDDLRQEIGPDAVDARVAELRQTLSAGYASLDQDVRTALQAAESASAGVGHIERSLERDKDRLWRDLLGPTVQLMGEETVGSGVLLRSEPIEGTTDFTTYVITAWHVIRDIQTTPESIQTPVPVTIYARTGDIRTETAQLLKFDTALDVALLRLNTTRPVDAGVKLASRNRLEDVSVFEHIYAVGCPLGNDPIPTFGEIADTHHTVDGQHYWMISAPTYIGNSGGGVFDAETHELLGIFTKIYTHGTLRPTVVPHMGLVTPLPVVYDWLEQVGFAQLEPVDANAPKAAAAQR